MLFLSTISLCHREIRDSIGRGENIVSKDKKTRPLTLQKFPDELYWQVKQVAAGRHVHMKQYIVAALEEAIKRDAKYLPRRKETVARNLGAIS
jgi:hypothetical protein